MEMKWSVLAALRAGREQARLGTSDGAIGAIRSLRGEVPAPLISDFRPTHARAGPAALLRGAAADHGLLVGGRIGSGALPARRLRESLGEVLRGADDLLVLLRRKRAGAALQAIAVGADELVLGFRRSERKTGRGAGREPDRAKQQRVVLGEIDHLVSGASSEAGCAATRMIGLLGGAPIGRGRGLGR